MSQHDKSKTLDHKAQENKEQEPSEDQENKEQEPSEDQENKEQEPSEEQGGSSQMGGTSPANVLEFLRKSNIINMDMPLKTLFENIQSLQPDPSSSWGVVGDSGHLVLVWKG